MKDVRIAVVGTGSIGLMMGAFLSRGGYDVTMISQFRSEMAELLASCHIRGGTVDPACQGGILADAGSE